MGSGEGISNGNFPNATTVTGTLSLATQSPLGTDRGSGNWVGKRVK